MTIPRRYWLLLAVLVLVGVPYYWLLIDNTALNVPQRRLDVAALRQLAAAIPGAKPDRIIVQDVAWRRVPGTLVVAGGGLKRNNLDVESFLMPRAAGGAIVVDSGITAQDSRALHEEQQLPRSQRLVEQALRRAGLILFTHEHSDHMAALLRMPDYASVVRHALITPEQLAGADKLPWPPGGRALLRPFAYQGMAAVAPGVVLIHTPGHTPGSQMIFVTLANGREYLFAGDTATVARSWKLVRARSRLLSDWLAPEDRAAVLGWLWALRDLKRQDPGLVIIPGHDLEAIRDPEHPSGILDGFDTLTPLPPARPAPPND
jgi:glyoxylase-like metal-dependent hydrolase (beta-lactamase superfamily II)